VLLALTKELPCPGPGYMDDIYEQEWELWQQHSWQPLAWPLPLSSTMMDLNLAPLLAFCCAFGHMGGQPLFRLIALWLCWLKNVVQVPNDA
jgi:hypothetical protein